MFFWGGLPNHLTWWAAQLCISNVASITHFSTNSIRSWCLTLTQSPRANAMPLLLRVINEKCPQLTCRHWQSAEAGSRRWKGEVQRGHWAIWAGEMVVGGKWDERGKRGKEASRQWKTGDGCWETQRKKKALGVCGGGRRCGISSDCSCRGNHIKAPESVNPNELQRSSRSGTLSPVTVLFQPIDLFSQ